MRSLAATTAAVVVGAIGVAVLPGCGGTDQSEPSEPVLGDSSDAEVLRKTAKERRIRALERRLAALDAAEAQKRRNGRAEALDAPEAALPDFDQLAASLGGQSGMVLGPVGAGQAVSVGTLADGAAWSTIKVALAARVITDRGGPDGLTDGERSLIEGALTISDNAAAEQLWQNLVARHGGTQQAAAAVGDVLHSAGDRATVISTEGRDGFSPYGQTNWSLPEQHRFMAALAGGCLPLSTGADHLLALMGQVTPSQRWGLGHITPSARLKGGWGPGTDGRYLVRQMGVIDTAAGPLVVTLAAIPADGTFASGTAMLNELADWAASNGVELAGDAGC